MTVMSPEKRSVAVVVHNGWCADCGGINEHYDHCLTHSGAQIVHIPPFVSGVSVLWMGNGKVHGREYPIEATLLRRLANQQGVPSYRAEISFTAWPGTPRQREKTTRVHLAKLRLRP